MNKFFFPLLTKARYQSKFNMEKHAKDFFQESIILSDKVKKAQVFWNHFLNPNLISKKIVMYIFFPFVGIDLIGWDRRVFLPTFNPLKVL